MRKQIIEIIEATVEDASQQAAMVSAWKNPLVGFADAQDPLFGQLKKAVRPSHDLPGDLLPGARTVIAYFLPFDPAIPRSNHRGAFSSEAWAVAYIETNQLIGGINDRINTLLEQEGFQGTRLPATHNFDEKDFDHKPLWKKTEKSRLMEILQGSVAVNNWFITT